MKEMKKDNSKGVVVIRKEHIQRGIERYNARVDMELKSILENSTFSATPYLFEDNRVLLVFDLSNHALLFDSMESIYAILTLE